MLCIGYPDIPADALIYASSHVYDSANPYLNSVNGKRYQKASVTATGGGGFNVEYDLGLGNTRSAQYLAICRADLLKAQGCTSVVLSRTTSGIGGAYTAEYTDASFSSATLYGPRSEDYLATFNTSTAYRGWKFAGSGGLDETRSYGNVFFGSYLAFSKQPSAYSYTKQIVDFKATPQSSGTLDRERLSIPSYVFTFTWDGLTDAEVKTWQEKIVAYKNINSYLLFTLTNNHHVLKNLRILQCSLVTARTQNNGKKPNWNKVTASFQELLG